ncbi:MAG: HAD family hydrolase [Bacillota bacterium]
MKAVFFDFDYTLADSAGAILECLRYALLAKRLPLAPESRMLATIGLTLSDAFKILAPDASAPELIELFKERADQIMVEATRLYPAAPPVLKSLKEGGYLLGIVSTKFRFRIEAVLEREKLDHLFDAIIGGEDVGKHKPDPEALLLAIEKTGSDKDSAAYVGDSIIDAQTAAAAGVAFIGVTSGVTSEKEFGNYPALAVVKDLTQLAAILGVTFVA